MSVIEREVFMRFIENCLCVIGGLVLMLCVGNVSFADIDNKYELHTIGKHSKYYAKNRSDTPAGGRDKKPQRMQSGHNTLHYQKMVHFEGRTA